MVFAALVSVSLNIVSLEVVFVFVLQVAFPAVDIYLHFFYEINVFVLKGKKKYLFSIYFCDPRTPLVYYAMGFCGVSWWQFMQIS